MNPKLVTLLTRIADTLERIERQHAPATPEPLPLLEAIARTYGTAQAVEVAAQVEIVRAEEAAAENGTARRTRAAGPRWSDLFPHLRALLETMRRQNKKAKDYSKRLETETDETARLFFQMEIERARSSANNAHRDYRAFIKQQIDAQHEQN
jgi:adenylate kinase family enzyme